ncbi:hypothetical protein HZI73_09470 [Vallitalea pronyensis]|uniref:Uncharacterized protein n=1 Tax=Vallitalea pronyensis TaxID=1348613 RepID=A0A8J8MIX9_9FIRM|nr:DUF6323 family protein [Vallitalea pronyensis]QUI22515.1 hypothetical protein HZI73_09470 [Vallitalea pronyensis]
MKLPLIIQESAREKQVQDIVALNEMTRAYGLVLSSHQVMQLIEERNRLLKGHGRIELGNEVMKKLIDYFYMSPFIEQDDYMLTLMALQDVFYYMKNETEDQISDDELLDIIKDFFENNCRGSIDLLQGREIENFTRHQRIQYQWDEFYRGGK